MSDDPVNTSLLERAGQGDGAAWSRLVELYSPLIAHWCRAKGVRAEDLPDVCQEVFCASFSSLPRYEMKRGSRAFLPWLRGITRFKIMEHFRQRAQEPNGDGGSDHIRQLQELHAPGDEESPETQNEERQILLRQALSLIQGQFQAQTWEAFWETVVETRSTADVADQLGMTTLAVRQARWRVLQRLREELGDALSAVLPDD